ncbi:chondroitin proteoglycan 2 [Eurytemora carolleeae]|uniref:chondroitin proteoglycan 2 n=1 Tax=Eurytemora carolleeae TaxID=1294199 RepID=UPI000C78FACD|nr:chondroitin proteoglycan 2 [Eurytemora carolleeae]|eukprot:XP_023323713.1 chondroitin proteoglycan 2-like [Eurytemora affinis]
MFKFLVLAALCVSVTLGQVTSDVGPRCEGFECPNDDAEGGLFTNGVCTGEFCDCSYGIPYLINFEEGLVFNEDLQVCDWPFNVEGCEEKN